ncbi:MAG: RIP metalloprotease RseP [Pseudomonadota bacterium]
MSLLFTIASFIVAIGVLVTVHEFGHFWVARRCGVRVLRFSVGFGRALWRRVGADGTEYVIAAIPLGGYVKMLDEREGDVPLAELDQAFNRKSLLARSAVVAAGPAANFLFAIAAYWLVFVIGVSGLRAEIGAVEPGSVAARSGLVAGHQVTAVAGVESHTWVAVIQRVLGGMLIEPTVMLDVKRDGASARELALDLDGVVLDDLTQGGFFRTLGMEPARPAHPAIIDALTPGGAAERAGLESGDTVKSADGAAIRNWRHWVSVVQSAPEQTLEVIVDRDGRELVLLVTPDARQRDAGDRSETYGFIGASRQHNQALVESYFVTERYGPAEAFGKALNKTWEISALTVRMFWKMLRLEVSVENLSGPISIAQYAGNSARSGPARFFEFLAIVSISLGILNLLPVPILDGGHLLYFAVEAVKGSPPSEQAQYVAQHVGLVLLVGLMGLAFYNDVMRVWGL